MGVDDMVNGEMGVVVGRKGSVEGVEVLLLMRRGEREEKGE